MLSNNEVPIAEISQSVGFAARVTSAKYFGHW